MLPPQAQSIVLCSSAAAAACAGRSQAAVRGSLLQQPPPCWEKGRFSPQNSSLMGRAPFAAAPRLKRNPIPVLSAPLGFLRAISSTWLLLLQRFQCLSPSFFHCSAAPVSPCPRPSVLPMAPPRRQLPRTGCQGGLLPMAHLHPPSSPSSPAPPFSKSLLYDSAGARGCAAAPQRPAPGEPPRRGWRRCRWRMEMQRGRGDSGSMARTGPALGDKDVTPKGALQQAGQREEALMSELSELVQKVVKSSSWWERHGVDISILGCSFLLLPAGFLCLRSAQAIPFLAGVLTLGVVHHTLTVKGSHLASHNALTESKSWGKVWAIFFIELCSAFTVEQATYNHVKIHHGYTNVIGLGDSSTWKLPFLNRYVYMFIAPLAVPILTPLVALDLLRNVEWKAALRTLCCMFLGLYCHYWLLLHVSGFQSPWSALLCMLLTRSLLAHPYIHVNIFQHIGLPMFAADRKPKRIQLMSLGVLNLPRNALLDWSFGHSLISCHVEHHLFPSLSDNMCLKIKPIVSQYLKQKKLPYNEDTYASRLRLFLQRYEELMVHAPPLTELVGIQ